MGNTEMFSAFPDPQVIQDQWSDREAGCAMGPNHQHSPKASVAALRLLGTRMVSFSLQVSTLVGEHCKGCQQKIKQQTVQGSHANSFISVSFKTLVCPHHKAWKVQEASKRDDQTHSHPIPNIHGHRTGGTKLALQPSPIHRCAFILEENHLDLEMPH